MKKILSLALLVPFVMFSCQEADVNTGDGNGQITIQGTSTVELTPNVITRAGDDVDQFTLYVENEDNGAVVASGLFSGFPGGVVDNIPAGSYKLRLTSHPNGFTPAFGDAWYEAVRGGVTVADGGNTLVDLEAEQANAGVYFVYDESLYSIGGYGEVVPTIKQGTSTLVYEGANAEAWGYFNPADAVLTLADGSTPLTIDGADSYTLELDAQQLWEITLKVTGTGTGGGMTITASVKVITSPTDFREFEVGTGDQQPDNGWIDITVSNWTLTTAVVNFKANTPITWGRFAVFSAWSVEAALAANPGATLADLMENPNNGNDWDFIDLLMVNSATGITYNYNLTDLEPRYWAIAYTESNGVRKVSDYLFRTDVEAGESPIETGTYEWTWYEIFSDDFSYYTEPYTEDLVINYQGNNKYIFQDFLGITNVHLTATYDPDAEMLTFDKFTTNGYQVIGSSEALMLGQNEYSAGIYVRDADLNLVETMVFSVADGKLDTNLYHVSFDVYTYGSSDPADFLYSLEFTPMGEQFAKASGNSAPFMKINKYNAVLPVGLDIRSAASTDLTVK